MYKKGWCTCKVVVFHNKPIAFFTSLLTLLSSLLKLPINHDEQEVALCKWKVRVACPKDKLVFESFLALHFSKSISYTFAFLGNSFVL